MKVDVNEKRVLIGVLLLILLFAFLIVANNSFSKQIAPVYERGCELVNMTYSNFNCVNKTHVCKIDWEPDFDGNNEYIISNCVPREVIIRDKGGN